MKTQLFFAVAAIAASTTVSLQKANAQTAPYWSLAGNSNATGSSILGTTNGAPLRVFAGGGERMHIAPATGYIGIGNLNPGYLLDVSGRIRIRKGAETAGAWFMNAANTVNSAFVGMLNDNTVGFYGSSGSGWGLTMNTATANVGIGTTTPITRLEVSRIDGDFLLARFTNASTTGDRTSLVDIQNGDGVIWRYGAGGTGNQLGLSNGQFYIERVGAGALLTMSTAGNVGIGTKNPAFSLDIANATSNARGLSVFKSFSSSVDQIGIYSSSVIAPGYGYGMQSYGGYMGIYAAANSSTYTGNGYGVYGIATGSAGNRYGVYGQASGGTTGNRYGVYGNASGGAFNAAGYFSGDVWTTTDYHKSDRKFKTNISVLKNSLELLMRLKPSTYQFRTDDYPALGFSRGRQIGLIADEVKQVFPELVKEGIQPAEYSSDKTKILTPEIKYEGVNYIGLIPVLIASIQEQQQEINELKQIVNQLSQRKPLTENNASLKTTNVFVGHHASLAQNNPNPFVNTTSINYNLPAIFTSAQIIITDANGKVMKQVPLNTAGKGMINFNAYNLSNGTYSYSLIVDGKLIDSKKMMVEK